MPNANKWTWFWYTRPYLFWLDVQKHAKMIRGLLRLAPPEYYGMIEEAYADYKTAHCLHVMARLWEADDE